MGGVVGKGAAEGSCLYEGYERVARACMTP